MSRLVILIVVLVLLAGGAFMLAGRNTAKTSVHVEKIVPDNALAH